MEKLGQSYGDAMSRKAPTSRKWVKGSPWQKIISPRKNTKAEQINFTNNLTFFWGLNEIYEKSYMNIALICIIVILKT